MDMAEMRMVVVVAAFLLKTVAANQCGYFRTACANHPNVCIWNTRLCNGQQHCPDGADESPSFCQSYNCLDRYRKCGDGVTCMHDLMWCDGTEDCSDGSDEANCGGSGPTQCRSDHRMCADGSRCVFERFFCDGSPDCPDGSDESTEECGQRARNCGPLKTNCPGHPAHCVFTSRICNGVSNCPEGSDEQADFCRSFACPTGKRKCADDVQCVHNSFFCDDFEDCQDGSDEAAVNCPAA